MPELLESTDVAKKDQDTEDLKAQLHKVLSDCAKAIGVDGKSGSKEEVIEVDSEKEDATNGQGSKRPRSTEVPSGGASGTPATGTPAAGTTGS